jgi:DNA recombination protein RmuC
MDVFSVTKLLLILMVIMTITILSALFLLRKYLINMNNPGTTKDDLKQIINEQLTQIYPDALNKSSDYLLKLNQEHLASFSKDFEQKKDLIDKSMEKVFGGLESLNKSTGQIGAQISTEIKNMGQQTNDLRTSTQKLNELLNNNQKRGQWGERVTEDILRSLGFIEGIGYKKQQTHSGDTGQTRPDYEFPLPGGLKVYMDVKFPFSGYEAYFNEPNKNKKEEHRKRFLTDVDRKVKGLPKYINPDDGTVDYVFMFIPNEAVMSFLYESDQGFFEKALSYKVLVLSPVTLYSALATLRHMLDTLKIKQSATEIATLMTSFNSEWSKFKTEYSKLGSQIQKIQDSYNGELSRRIRVLEKPLAKIEDIKNGTYIDINSNIDLPILDTDIDDPVITTDH